MRKKAIKFLPLTFVAGAWGFVVFVPYLFAFAAVVGLASRFRRTPVRVPVPIN